MGDIRSYLSERSRCIKNVRIGDLHRVVTNKGQLAREHLVHHHAQGVDIGPEGNLVTPSLFWREIVRGPKCDASLGHSRISNGFGDAEIRYLDLAIRSKQYVLWLQIAMNKSRIVCRGDAPQNLCHYVAHLGLGERRVFIDIVFEVLSRYILHGDEVSTVRLIVVVNIHDVWMGEHSSDSSFVLETMGKRCIAGVGIAEQLEGDDSSQMAIPCSEDLGGSSVSYLLQKLVATNRCICQSRILSVVVCDRTIEVWDNAAPGLRPNMQASCSYRGNVIIQAMYTTALNLSRTPWSSGIQYAASGSTVGSISSGGLSWPVC